MKTNFSLNILILFLTIFQPSKANTFSNGDVFLGRGGGIIDWVGPPPTYTSQGTINTGIVGTTTGMRINPVTHELWVTHFNTKVSIINTNGVLSSIVNLSPYQTSTESIVFDLAGNAYVGGPGGELVKLSPAGVILDHYVLDVEMLGGPDWIDLCADQHTIYYTYERSKIKRYDVSTHTQLTDFVNLSAYTPKTFAVRLLPDCSALIASGTNVVYRISNTGSIQTTYHSTNPVGYFALALSPDGTKFFAGGHAFFGPVYEFDIATGVVLSVVNSSLAGINYYGIAVYNDTLLGACCAPIIPVIPTIPGKYLIALAICFLLAGSIYIWKR